MWEEAYELQNLLEADWPHDSWGGSIPPATTAKWGQKENEIELLLLELFMDFATHQSYDKRIMKYHF